MKVFFIFACLLLAMQLGFAEEKPAKELNQKKEQITHKDTANTGNLVIYKDRCLATLPIKLSEKSNFFTVAGSLDPQSILFRNSENSVPEYTVTKDKGAAAADLVFISKSPFQGELTYSFSGITWHMHYVVEINELFDQIQNFNSFVSIDNQSGVSFENIQLRLVDAQTDVLAKNQTFNEYVTSIQKSIYKGSITRIPWVDLHGQKAEQDYRLDVGGDILSDIQGSERRIPLQIWLRFNLNKDLAKDLASGDVIIYIRDNANTLRFLGTSTLPATKAGDNIQLGISPHLLAQLKSSQDSPLSQIQGTIEQTEFKTLLTEKVIEAAYRLTIRNFGDKEVTIKVMLPFGKNHGKVIRESVAHKQENAQSVYWPIKVAQKSEVVLRYRVQLMKE
jgi:hypothetical protein